MYIEHVYNAISQRTGRDAFHRVPIPHIFMDVIQTNEPAGAVEPVADLNPQLPPEPPDPPDWYERARQCRAEEWTLANKLIALCRRMLLRHITQMRPNTSLAQVEKLLQLATKLARVSTDFAQNPTGETECRECCRSRLEMEEALHRIYGEAAEKKAAAERPSTINQQPTKL